MMTTITKLDKWNPDPETIAHAATIIRSGGLVSFPTETVYGLGADALNPDAVRKIYAAKGRPSDNPLILHVSSPEQAEGLVYLNDTARELMRIFWPAPLTLVLPARDCIPLTTRGGLDTAAVRMPDNPIALALISAAGTPIAAPSANLSGRPSPTTAQDVFRDMNGRIDYILDGGSVDVGIESTVIDITNPEKVLMLRPGGMSREVIEEALHQRLEVPDSASKKRSPGTRYRHYAPDIPVIIWNKDKDFPAVDASAGYIGMTASPLDTEIIFDGTENYARGLFSGFRELEAKSVTCIVAEWPESPSGLGEGLRDRITRAAGG